MALLIFAIILLIVVALIVYAIGLLPLPDPFGRIIQALVILLAAILIADRAGLI